MQTFLPIHYLTPLESDECWSLLAKHAFGGCNFRQRANLEVIGKEIAKKCDGLPLAAIALGGLLRTKSSEDDRNNVLKSNIWSLENIEVQPALLLSYHYLPAPLKRCFAYCSIFPKSSKFEKKMVVKLWIAEGLVHQSKSKKNWEKVGEEYFDELVSRSLIRQRRIDDTEASFEMHDLINDLATMVSSPYCIKLDEEEIHEKVRHVSYNKGKYDSYNKFDKLYGLKGLRTFLALPIQVSHSWSQPCCSVSDKVMRDFLPTMKKLRVLSMSNYRNITELPDSIGNLIYLRYLNLSYTAIEKLPSATCKLYNMQTLLLTNCANITELPKDMGNLVNLCHLDIRGTLLKEMHVEITKLQNLQTLSNFIVNKQHDGLKIAQLGKFPHLQGNLNISKLQNVIDPSDAFHSNLKTKEQIDQLVLQWDPQGTTTQGSQIQSLVIEQLRPSTNLKNLHILGYGGTNFPKWLGDSSFGNMVNMSIGGCNHCTLLPPLGQLHCLKELCIYWMASITYVGAEFYGRNCPSFQPFPSLETLEFDDMPEWEEWNLTIEFPSLKRLLVDKCPKLKGNIPSTLPSLIELELMECDILLEARHSGDNRNLIIRPSDVFSHLLFPLNCLQKLTLVRFPSLTSFPRDGLPKTLQSLSLDYCENLEFLPHQSLHNYTSLEQLSIEYSCNSMTSFTLGSLPVLENLYIKGCKNLKSISIAKDASLSLSLIQSIQIRCCNELDSFSPGGLPTPNLIRFGVHECNKLHSLPEPMSTLIGLQELRVFNLPNLQHFANEGLPINLRKISIGGIMWNIEFSLENITCLSMIKMEMPLLPSSLTSLHIYQLDYIECLDGKWLQHLTFIQNLQISYAPKLKSLPEEGLPSSLSVLSISDCPLLEATCRTKQGKEWRKIAHIPCILINNKMIT
ncbi:putative disease resistance RPP13-like protein 1 [Cicer arietinum]